MAKTISASMAKAQLSSLLGGVLFRGERYVIQRRGRPVAALVSIEELNHIEHETPAGGDFRGFLPLVGSWADVPDEEIDALISEIYAGRAADTGRPVDLGE